MQFMRDSIWGKEEFFGHPLNFLYSEMELKTIRPPPSFSPTMPLDKIYMPSFGVKIQQEVFTDIESGTDHKFFVDILRPM